ncbi:MAG: class I SAM-dependent methyltransferase [Mucilaginibacter sp.]
MKPIYDTLGKTYNSTRKADLYIAGRLSNFLNPQPGGLYLDIGCGTGNYTIALADMGLNFVGVEPSEEMLKVARNRNEEIEWLRGSAENIPVEDNTFDGVIATLTIHHWDSLTKSFSELARVIKPGASIVLFTADPKQMEHYWLNHYFPQVLKSSIAQMPSFDVINDALAGAGFEIGTTEKYFVQDDLQDTFLYAGKNKPQIYLDEAVRKGMSSFAALANAEEVRKGLLKLQIDFEDNKFISIKNSYNNNLGDYLFIVAKKKNTHG